MSVVVSFGKLGEVRDVARARAMEDFEYFANSVLNARLDPQVCRAMQKSIEQNVFPQGTIAQLRALNAWLIVLGKKSVVGGTFKAPTETFAWLFFQECAA